MDQKALQYKHVLTYGSITGGAIVLFMLLMYIFGMLNNAALTNVSGILFVVGGYLSVRNFRKKREGGIISYGKAYAICFLTFLTTGFIWSIYEYILYKYLSPGLLETKMIEAQDALLKLGWTEEKVEALTTLSSPTALSNAFGYFFNTAVWGAVLALLIAAIMKREGNPLLKSE